MKIDGGVEPPFAKGYAYAPVDHVDSVRARRGKSALPIKEIMMNQTNQTAQQEQLTLITELTPFVLAQTAPFDAYRLSKLVGRAPMAVGRALNALSAMGRLVALGEAPEESLAERYIVNANFAGATSMAAANSGPTHN